jgi:FAD/FMN-containing dehydrogenase
VARALECGRAQSLVIAVRGGGHDLFGRSVCEDGVVIDLSLMNAIEVDARARRVRVQAGARSRDVNNATDAHGLVAALGCHPDVGVAGLTLGGGLGWFMGRFGAACDNLRSASVITADGKRLIARDDENADLFWAVRGGGGNFGIATELELLLHAAGPVLGGSIAFGTDVGAFLRSTATSCARRPIRWLSKPVSSWLTGP